MTRARLKSGLAGAACRTGLDKVAGAINGRLRMPVIVGYHRVVEDFHLSSQTSIPSLLITTQMLERQLDWIGRRHRFIDVGELAQRLESGEESGKPVAAVTFDDGYRDFYEIALPLLRRKGIPSALFVVTDLVGTARTQIHDRLYLLLKRRSAPVGELSPRLPHPYTGTPLPNISEMSPYDATRALLEHVPLAVLEHVAMTLDSEDPLPPNLLRDMQSVDWETLRSIRDAGVVIGSHTSGHVLMPNESQERIAHEAGNSRRQIESHLGMRVQHFAYPSGFFNADSVNAVAGAGYRCAYTTCSHRDPAFPMLTLPRTLLWEKSCLDHRLDFSESILRCQLRGAFDFWGGCKQRHASRRTESPKRISAYA